MKTIWQYQSFLPKVDPEFRVQLGEGQTPLIRSKGIAQMLGLKNLYFKLENLNPTGSYKDRFAAVVVSSLVGKGEKLCIATSSGNTGAALAAYCAAAGIACFVAIVEGAPVSKIRQMQLYGATVFVIKGFGKNAEITTSVFKTLHAFACATSLPLPISAYQYCEVGMRGVQTIAYEVLDEMYGNTNHIFCPAGGGGLCLAIAKGTIEYYKNRPDRFPKVHCVQPMGNNTIAGALRNDHDKATPVQESKTIISGLQVPGVLDGNEVIRHCRLLNGNGFLVTDEEVAMWQRELAHREGIFSEPAGAVALAGVARAIGNNEINRDEKIVCLVTGSGFKDLASVEDNFHLPVIQTISNIKNLVQELTYL